MMMQIPEDDMTWYLDALVTVNFLISNKEHPDMDKRYLVGQLEELVHRAPVGVNLLLIEFMSSPEGDAWLEEVRQEAQRSPYVSDDRLKD